MSDARVKEAMRLINWAVQHHARPAVLWSSGKDSMVLLHLVREMGLVLPCVLYRIPQAPWKMAFAERVIQDWGLEVWDYPPAWLELARGNGVTELVSAYQIGESPEGQMLVNYVPRNLREMPDDQETLVDDEGHAWQCGRELLERPVGGMRVPWDCLLLGSKGSDVDAVRGPVPLAADVLSVPGAPAQVYPLRTWTDAEIWEYIEAHQVPYPHDRYNREEGYKEWVCKRLNPDWVECCMRCLDPERPAVVRCPKSGLKINSIAGRVRWAPVFTPAAFQAGEKQK